jgi:hypothetical protein
MEKIEPIELKDFIKQTIAEIEEGVDLNKRSLGSPIDFDISITRSRKVGGSIKVYVVGGEGETSRENIARVQFKVNPHYPPSKFENLPHHAESDYDPLG